MPTDSDRPVGFSITSDPDITSINPAGNEPARQRNDLPFRLLLASDLAPQADVADWSDGSQVRKVDASGFAEVMAAMAPRLNLEVPNRISTAPRLLDVDLRFARLDDFEPAAVVRQVPALAQLLDIRTLVEHVRSSQIDLDTFQARLQDTGVDADWAAQLYGLLTKAPTEDASENRGGDSPLDRILGLVGMGDGSVSAPPTPKPSGGGGLMDALIGAVTSDKPAGPGVERGAAAALIDDLDRVIGDQLNAIFGHPTFRRFEAAWRGLRFLTKRLPFRKNVQLEVLAVSREHLSEALYYQVLLPEHDEARTSPPLSMLVLDFAFDSGHEDIEQLDDLAETGASLQSVVLASAAPSFFGKESETELDRMPTLLQHFQGAEYIEWNKLREKKEAKHLTLALPSFLLRSAYGSEQPTTPFYFKEEGALWGGAALVAAAAAAESFAETGWPTHLAGTERQIENLPLHKVQQGKTPLASLIPEAKLGELAKAGFTVLGGRPNHDAVHVSRAQTICRPETYEDLMAATEARVHVTLPCQLFVARAAHFLLEMQRSFEPTAQPEEEVRKRMQAFLHTEGQRVPPDAVEVERVSQVDMPEHHLLAVRVRTPSYVLPRPVSVVMGVQVPKIGSEPA